MVYLNKYVGYWEVDKKLPDSYLTGESVDDFYGGAYILLTEEQIAFHVANPSASHVEVLKMELDTKEPTPEELFERLKDKKLREVEDADQISNRFFVNGLQLWLDKSTRTSLLANTIPAERRAGNTQTSLWYEGQPPIEIPVPIDWLEEKLSELELYAKETYDVTQKHRALIYAAESYVELEKMDAYEEYPEPPQFTLG